MSIRHNTLYNLFGSLVPLVVSLITVPLYLGLIGEARYGVLAIAWLLLGYFGLFDLGLGRATAQRIAVLHDAPTEQRAQIFWTALTLNVCLGILGGLLIWPAAFWFFGNIFQIEEALRPEMAAAVPWLILAVPMATLSGVLTGALQGRERFLELNLISVLGTLLFQLLPLVIATFWGVDLGLLLPAALFARLVTLFVLFARCQRYIIQGHAPSFTRKQAGQLLRFGGWVTVSSFVGPLMVVLDRFIIGVTVGAKAVAYYAVPMQLAERTTILPNALTSALFPRFSSAHPAEEKILASDATKILIVIMTPIIVTAILLLKPFLIWWVGANFAEQSADVGQILLLGFWFNGLARVPHAQLQARGKPHVVAICHLFELLPYLFLLYVGLEYLGLMGAAIAFSVRVAIDFFLLANMVGSLLQFSRQLFVPLIFLAASLMLSCLKSLEPVEWLVYNAMLVLLTASWALWLAPESIKLGIRRKLKVFLKDRKKNNGIGGPE